jgi:hypothetical protein
MQKCILFGTNVHKTGVEGRGDFTDPAKVNVADLKLLVILLTAELYEAAVLGGGHFKAVARGSDKHGFCHNTNKLRETCGLPDVKKRDNHAGDDRQRQLFLLVAIFSEALFSFVRSDFVTLSFFTARHNGFF